MFLFYFDLPVFSIFSLGFCISHVNVTVLITAQGKYDPLLTLTQSFAPITLVQLYLDFYKWQIQIWEASCTDLIMPYFPEVIFACPKTVTLMWTSFIEFGAWKQHQRATSCMFLKLRLFLMARLTNGFLFLQTPAELCLMDRETSGRAVHSRLKDHQAAERPPRSLLDVRKTPLKKNKKTKRCKYSGV